MEPGRVNLLRFYFTAALLLSLAACNQNEAENEKPLKPNASKPAASSDAVIAGAEKPLGTPMAERVAVLGLLNKRNGEARDLELKPGQYIRMGKVEVRLRACERTAPWETYADHGAFVQLVLFERPAGTTDAPKWRQVFSGWLFKENPAANVVQHPIYDVWVKECKMSFPGEEEVVAPKASADSASNASAKAPSSTPQSAPAQPDVGPPEEPSDAAATPEPA
jgi:hypothetical protein